LSGFVYPFRKYLNTIVSFFGLHQSSSFRHIIGASFVGTFSHVFLDSLLYPEMNPFYPVFGNPFVGLFSFEAVYNFCVFVGLIGFGFYFLRVLLKPKPIASREDPFT
jgi:membrane-bound metal-dependent hydrolase YbcI (DUF457 family)